MTPSGLRAFQEDHSGKDSGILIRRNKTGHGENHLGDVGGNLEEK